MSTPPPLSFKNIAWLLISLLMVIAPHVPRLPLWLSTLCAAVIAWRLYLVWRGFKLPPRPLLLVLTFGAMLGIFISHGSLFGRDAGVSLLIVLTAMKLLEMRDQRDATVAVFLGYFIVMTNFLYSQSIFTGLYLLLVVLVITATLAGFHFRVAQPDARARFTLAGLLLAQSLPLMLVLFLFFPRVQGPLWGLPQDAYAGVSGLSDSMSPGSISQMILSDAVAFRATFESEIPKASQLYWRGPVLWHFNGKTWTAGHKSAQGAQEYTALDKPTRYSVTLEAHNNHWLLALDLPAYQKTEDRGQRTVEPAATDAAIKNHETAPANMSPSFCHLPSAVCLLTADYQMLSSAPVKARLRYDMASHLNYRAGTNETPQELTRALQLPKTGNPQARALAATWRQTLAGDDAIVNAALKLFRAEKFFYTLLPPALGDNPVDEFLFDTRQGFCEHYSSSFVFLMRAAGIPARVVTGYLGGEVNPQGNYLIVRQSEAHAWTEVWTRERGWARVDPTAAVSPARVESGIARALPASDPLPMLTRTNIEWLRGIRLQFDAVAHNWNQWVLGYNPQKQLEFMSRIGVKAPDWQSMTTALFVGVAGVLLVFAASMLRRLQRKERDPVQAAYLVFCAKLAKRGVPRHPHEGPQQFAARLAQLRPDLAEKVDSISDLYIRLRYGTVSGKEWITEFKRQVGGFRIED